LLEQLGSPVLRFLRLLRLGSGFGFALGSGVMPPISFEVTHSIALFGMLYLPHGVCVATDLPQNEISAVDIVIPLLERLGIGIPAWHYRHFKLFEGHVYRLAVEIFGLILQPYVVIDMLCKNCVYVVQ